MERRCHHHSGRRVSYDRVVAANLGKKCSHAIFALFAHFDWLRLLILIAQQPKQLFASRGTRFRCRPALATSVVKHISQIDNAVILRSDCRSRRRLNGLGLVHLTTLFQPLNELGYGPEQILAISLLVKPYTVDILAEITLNLEGKNVMTHLP